MERDINKHHIWFNRKNFYTPAEKTLRGLGGFTLGIYAPAHRLLHAQLKPMVKPPRYMVDDLIDVARGVNQEHRFSVLDMTTAHLLSNPYDDYEKNIRAARLGNHLLTQRQYFNLHPLEGDELYGE